jgi:hypothetical protein
MLKLKNYYSFLLSKIYIECHSLCGIVRVLCRDDSINQHRPLNAFLQSECTKLDSLLNECLTAAKVAKSKVGFGTY